MVERLIITLMVLLVAIIGIRLLRRRQLRRAQQALQVSTMAVNTPAIVYFWSPSCGQCLSMQKPILERIVSQYGEGRIRLITHNVDETLDVAKAWGVTTVPTTVIVDAQGEVSHVNSGLVTERTLRHQLQMYSMELGAIQ